MDSSHYIDTMQEAEYELLEPAKVPATHPQLAGFYSAIIDLITAGNRGKAFTWALNGAGLSTNPAALDAAYKENRTAVNAYLQHVDLDEIIRLITEEEQQKPLSLLWFRQKAPVFAAGAAVGAIALSIFKK